MPKPKSDWIKLSGWISDKTASPEIMSFTKRMLENMDQGEFLREAVTKFYEVSKGNYFTMDKLRETIPVILKEMNLRPYGSNSQEVSASRDSSPVQGSVPVQSIPSEVRNTNSFINSPVADSQAQTSVTYESDVGQLNEEDYLDALVKGFENR